MFQEGRCFPSYSVTLLKVTDYVWGTTINRHLNVSCSPSICSCSWGAVCITDNWHSGLEHRPAEHMSSIATPIANCAQYPGMRNHLIADLYTHDRHTGAAYRNAHMPQLYQCCLCKMFWRRSVQNGQNHLTDQHLRTFWKCTYRWVSVRKT